MPRRSASLAALLLIGAAVALPASAAAQGMLIPTDQRADPLGLEHHRVEIDVTDGAAVTTIEQVYVNATDRPLEATYFFPIPDDAVIIDFRLMIDGEMKRGEVLDRDEANRIYSEIVRRVQDPGIIDWMDHSLFRARIFPVPPRGEQKLTIRYTQALPFVDGTYRVAYPLKSPRAAAKTLEDFTLTTRIAHRTPIKTVYSPSHKVAVARDGEHRAVVGFEADQVTLDEDFVLYFGVSKDDLGLTLLTHRPDEEPGYFMLMATPKAVFDTDEIQGKAVTFVLDTSGSMTGAKLAHAKRALTWSLDQLGHDDRFNVIRFSSDIERFQPELVTASSDRVAAAKRFVESFDAAGGTAIDDALAQALAADSGDDPHLVLFITDGRPTIGETSDRAILDHVGERNADGRARIFALGVGDDIHTQLLDQLSDHHGGTSAYVAEGDDMDTHISALYQQIAFPVLTDVALEISGVRTYGAMPRALPDVFRGGQLMVVGRYRDDGDALARVTGRMGDDARRFDFEGTFPARQRDHAFIANIWAHRQVGVLLDKIRLEGETKALIDEVVQLAKRYGIVTPYTSYLVVEDDPPTQPTTRPPVRPTPRQVPTASEIDGDLPRVPTAAREDREREVMDFGAGGAARGVREGRTETAKSGRDAVVAAKQLRRLKDKAQSGSETSRIRRASGRVFVWRDRGGWTDDAVTPSLERVEIAPFSDGWMALVDALPSLRDALALGEAVTVRVGDLVIAVRSGGPETLDEDTLARVQAAIR